MDLAFKTLSDIFFWGMQLHGAFLRLPVHDLPVFPAVVVGLHQSEVFGMQLVVTNLLLPFPFLQVALDDFEALRLPQVNADRHLLAADIEFHGLAVAYLLLLLRAQLDVVHLLHVLQLLFQPYFSYAAVNDGLRFRVKLEVLPGLFAVHIHGLLDDFPLSEAFRFLFRQGDSLVAFRFESRPEG